MGLTDSVFAERDLVSAASVVLRMEQVESLVCAICFLYPAILPNILDLSCVILSLFSCELYCVARLNKILYELKSQMQQACH